MIARRADGAFIGWRGEKPELDGTPIAGDPDISPGDPLERHITYAMERP